MPTPRRCSSGSVAELEARIESSLQEIVSACHGHATERWLANPADVPIDGIVLLDAPQELEPQGQRLSDGRVAARRAGAGAWRPCR